VGARPAGCRTRSGGLSSSPLIQIAGVALGDGFGLASRHLGLAIDSLEGVNIVTADVTEFVLRTHPVPARSTYFQVRWPWPSADGAIDAWQNWAPHTTDKITSILHLNAGDPPPSEPTASTWGPPAMSRACLHRCSAYPAPP
jgi:hypothetical protein